MLVSLLFELLVLAQRPCASEVVNKTLFGDSYGTVKRIVLVEIAKVSPIR